MRDSTPGRRPTGSGVDGSYTEHRKPTVDANDDVDDEDGILMDEAEDENDLTLQVEDPAEDADDEDELRQ